MSPASRCAVAAVRKWVLGGGFWLLRSQDVRITTLHEDGRVLDSRQAHHAQLQ